MGRRALPKIDPRLDYSGRLLCLDELPVGRDPHDLFPRRRPLELEVGSGKGLFLLNATARSPEHNFLGIEVSGKYARFCAARLAKHQRENGLMIHGDARRFLEEMAPASCFTAVHMYFPDPWWKKRHHKRRLLDESFASAVERSLADGGVFHLWTDVESYFEAALQTIADATELSAPRTPEEQAAQHDLDYRTHFERRVRLHRQRVYRAEFFKGQDQEHASHA